MSSPLIVLKNISKHYGDQPVLKSINLTVHAGELVAIMGPSGAGKSTLMHLLGLLDTATSGSYRLGGELMTKHSDDKLASLRNQCIGFVFQSFFLLPRFTVLENVCLPLFYRQQSNPKSLGLSLLKQVGMEQFASYKPNQLSGGQQQRVAIARALIGSPALLLADEPTGALDSKTSQLILNLFKQFNQTHQMTTIIITHDEAIAKHCQRVIVLQDGTLTS